jgi:hypothetical protein
MCSVIHIDKGVRTDFILTKIHQTSSLASGSVVVTSLVAFLSSFASCSSLLGDSSFALFV